MSCQESNCSAPAELICEVCSQFKIFCRDHGLAHSKTTGHESRTINEEDKEFFMLRNQKMEIMNSIDQISNESEIARARIDKASKIAIEYLKEQKEDITTDSNLKLELFEDSTIQNIREEATSLISRIHKLGTIYLAFSSLSLEEKKDYVRSYWEMINVDDFELLLLSENGKYLFACTFYLGIRQADKNHDRM